MRLKIRWMGITLILINMLTQPITLSKVKEMYQSGFLRKCSGKEATTLLLWLRERRKKISDIVNGLNGNEMNRTTICSLLKEREEVNSYIGAIERR